MKSWVVCSEMLEISKSQIFFPDSAMRVATTEGISILALVMLTEKFWMVWSLPSLWMKSWTSLPFSPLIFSTAS